MCGRRGLTQVSYPLPSYSHHTHSANSSPIPSGGNLNFITGAGGYLQNFIYGYSGMHLGPANLTFAPQPILPPGSVTQVKLRCMAFLDTTFSLWYNATTLCAQLCPSNTAMGTPLQLVEADGSTTHAIGAATPACVSVQQTLAITAAKGE